jgi:hypothetical protein
MATTTDAFSVCKYRMEDEQIHPDGGAENYNESAYFNFLDPGMKIGAILRVGNRPTLGYREYSVNMKLPGGSIALRSGREQSEANSGFACAGLTLTCEDPTRSWSVSYLGTLSHVTTPARLARNPGRVLKSSSDLPCEIHLEWRAHTPMFVLSPDGGGAASPGATSTMGTHHYEQFGTVTGRIRLGSHCWELADVPSMRDHSWGPRVWGSFVGEWTCGFLPGGTGMSLCSEMQPNGLRVCSGAVIFNGEPHFVQDWEVLTDYDGGASIEPRHRSVLRAEGLPTMPLDGRIAHFSPLAMGTGEQRTRLASMTVEYLGGAGGMAFAEFHRPIAATL